MICVFVLLSVTRPRCVLKTSVFVTVSLKSQLLLENISSTFVTLAVQPRRKARNSGACCRVVEPVVLRRLLSFPLDFCLQAKRLLHVPASCVCIHSLSRLIFVIGFNATFAQLINVCIFERLTGNNGVEQRRDTIFSWTETIWLNRTFISFD